MASIKNILVVTIMQVAVIVVGVLAAGVCHRVFTADNVAMPGPAAMLYGHGVIGLLIPVVWGIGTVVIYLRTNISDESKTLAFWFGVLVLIVIVAFVLYADIPPWFNGVIWNVAGGDE